MSNSITEVVINLGRKPTFAYQQEILELQVTINIDDPANADTKVQITKEWMNKTLDKMEDEAVGRLKRNAIEARNFKEQEGIR